MDMERRMVPGRRSRADRWITRLAAVALTGALLAWAVPAGLASQDAHFIYPIPEIEERLRVRPLQVLDWTGTRMEGDRTQRVVLGYEDQSVMAVKWANAPEGGGRFNNEPRYEAAAYEIQKLFLDESEYVVPPTILRAFPREFVENEVTGAPVTFSTKESVVVTLQYWLSNVTQENFWDPVRAAQDSLYARHIGNMNILTYLIRHSDSNVGNFLISRSPGNPRLFSVDNGVAFRSPDSDRGYEWRDLQVRRLPRSTVDRLRTLTFEDFERMLAVVAEFENRDGELVLVTPGQNMGPRRGVRRDGTRVQFGLTTREIRDIENRRLRLLRMVDRGTIHVF
jgi:hypothetical protein